MPTYSPTPTINSTVSPAVLMPNVTVYFVTAYGSTTPEPITSLGGAPLANLNSGPLCLAPAFATPTATSGYLTDLTTVWIKVISDDTQDGATAARAAATQAQGYVTQAQQAAADAAGAVGGLASQVNSLSGDVQSIKTQLANGGGSSGGGAPAIAAGMKLNTTINAADTGNAWPSPIRLSGDPIYAVTFLGPIAPPPAVAVGSPDGMQPGDTYYYTGS